MTSQGRKTRDEVEAELQAFAASRRSAERRLHAAQAAQMAQVRSHAQATARRVDDQVKRAVRPEPARASRPVTAPLARMTPKRDPLMDALERAYLGAGREPGGAGGEEQRLGEGSEGEVSEFSCVRCGTAFLQVTEPSVQEIGRAQRAHLLVCPKPSPIQRLKRNG